LLDAGQLLAFTPRYSVGDLHVQRIATGKRQVGLSVAWNGAVGRLDY
jgi:hypothetical protein